MKAYFDFNYVTDKQITTGTFAFYATSGFRCPKCEKVYSDFERCDCDWEAEDGTETEEISVVVCPICERYGDYGVSSLIPVAGFPVHLDEEHFT